MGTVEPVGASDEDISPMLIIVRTQDLHTILVDDITRNQTPRKEACLACNACLKDQSDFLRPARNLEGVNIIQQMILLKQKGVVIPYARWMLFGTESCAACGQRGQQCFRGLLVELSPASVEA